MDLAQPVLGENVIMLLVALIQEILAGKLCVIQEIVMVQELVRLIVAEINKGVLRVLIVLMQILDANIVQTTIEMRGVECARFVMDRVLVSQLPQLGVLDSMVVMVTIKDVLVVLVVPVVGGFRLYLTMAVKVVLGREDKLVGVEVLSQNKPALRNAPVMEAVWLLAGTLTLHVTFIHYWILLVALVLMLVTKTSAHPSILVVRGVLSGRLVLKVVVRQVGVLGGENVYVNTKY